MELPKRKPNRLPDYDYSTPGAYFITICTKDRKPILSQIVGGGALDAPYAQLTKFGQIVHRYILSGNRIPGVAVDKFVIMPNHIHLILLVDGTIGDGASKAPSPTIDGTAGDGASKAPSPTKDVVTGGPSRAPAPTNAVIPHFVSTLKRFCHRDIGQRIFQRSYHDHIIRDERDYLKIWNYIDGNPSKWEEDCFYTE